MQNVNTLIAKQLDEFADRPVSTTSVSQRTPVIKKTRLDWKRRPVNGSLLSSENDNRRGDAK
jgi:hypothetical protein